MTHPAAQPARDLHARPVFRSIVCGVDGSPSSLEAARQAAMLGGAGAEITLVAVGAKAPAGGTLDAAGGAAAVEQAAAVISRAGGDANERVIVSPDPSDALLGAARDCDLLVVSSHGRSRTFGLLMGSTASVLPHRARVPVLIARRPPLDRPILDSILLASDGRPEADYAVEVAGALAARQDSRLALVHVEDGRELPAGRLAEQCARLIELTGVEPIGLPDQGPPDERIVEASERVRASLIVTGARTLNPLVALSSVSERIAHDARCSVLIARPR